MTKKMITKRLSEFGLAYEAEMLFKCQELGRNGLDMKRLPVKRQRLVSI